MTNYTQSEKCEIYDIHSTHDSLVMIAYFLYTTVFLFLFFVSLKKPELLLRISSRWRKRK